MATYFRAKWSCSKMQVFFQSIYFKGISVILIFIFILTLPKRFLSVSYGAQIKTRSGTFFRGPRGSHIRIWTARPFVCKSDFDEHFQCCRSSFRSQAVFQIEFRNACANFHCAIAVVEFNLQLTLYTYMFWLQGFLLALTGVYL
jgi:hypothetical protein